MAYEKRECPLCKKQKNMFDWNKVCFDCEQQQEKKRISSDVLTQGESSNEKWIFCPWCGAEVDDGDLHETTDTYCDSCDKEFHLEVEYDIKYSTSKKVK